MSPSVFVTAIGVPESDATKQRQRPAQRGGSLRTGRDGGPRDARLVYRIFRRHPQRPDRVPARVEPPLHQRTSDARARGTASHQQEVTDAPDYVQVEGLHGSLRDGFPSWRPGIRTTWRTKGTTARQITETAARD